MISKYENTYDIVTTIIRCSEGQGKLFHPNAAKRVTEKCAPFLYTPSCVDRMEAALNAEIIYSSTVNRIDECCGGYRVLVGWQEWMLFREWMI
jgi:hypothetical protein